MKNMLEKCLNAQVAVVLLLNLQLYVQNVVLKLLEETLFLQSKILKNN